MHYIYKILFCLVQGYRIMTNNFLKLKPDQICKWKKNRILLYSWLPTGTQHKNLAIWNFLFFEIGELGPFFPQKILYGFKSYFSGQNLTKFPPPPPQPSHLPPFKKTQPMHSSSGKLWFFLQRNVFVAKMTIFHRKMQKS